MTGIAIVTGASRGIGAATARVLAREGWDVCVAYRSEAAAADAVAHDVTAAGRRAITIKADTGEPADIERLFETCDRELGRLSGLVNNAGIAGTRGRFADLPAEDLVRVMAVNVRGYMLCAREAVRRMSTKRGGAGGAIVNVSSGNARTGAPGELVLYSTSKGGVNSLTIGLSQEVADEGIRVNTIAPGLIDTDMPGPAKIERVGPTIPLGRAGRPEEIAECIAWLMSDRASYVAGALFRAGGGRI